MATTRNRRELVNEALSKLTALEAGQDPSPEDYDVVDRKVPDVLADLAFRDIIYIADPEAIPLAPFQWVAIMLADACATDLVKPRDPQGVAVAENNLRVIAYSRPTYEPLRMQLY